MVHKVNIQITTPYLLTNPTTGVVVSGATITCSIYDEADNAHASGNMTEVGATGLYYYNWTPNAIGVWKVVISCASPVSNHSFIYHVGSGIEADINTALTTHDTAIKNLIGTPFIDMSADILAVWTILSHGTHGLAALKTEIDNNETDIDTNETKIDVLTTNLATHDNDIKSLLNDATYGLSALETLMDNLRISVGTNTDAPDMTDSLFAGQQALFHNTHHHFGMVVADKGSLTADETQIKNNIEVNHDLYIVDEDDVDSGNFDFAICAGIFISSSCTDMTKLNELTTVAVPIVTDSPEVALTIFRMGDDSGGAGTSWGTSAAQTQINIVDITHQITLTLSTGNLTIYSVGQTINWLRASDLVGGAVELAEVSGDSTKTTMAVLPYDIDDEDGNPAPAIRVFLGGLNNYADLNTVGSVIFAEAEMWILHQGIRQVEVQGLGKINLILQKLGGELSNADNLYDYIVTGANEAGAFPVITANKAGSVLERIEALMQKDTTPAFDSDTDSLEAIREALDTHDTDIKADIGDFSGQGNLTSLLAALGIPDVAGKSLYTCLITDRLDNATFGLSAIEVLVDDLETRLTAARAGYLDELDFDLDARLGTPSTSIVADIAADFDRHVTWIDCWGDEVATVTITGGSTDVNLPDVIIPTLPTGATIWKVVLLFKCALIRDTSGSDNAINGAAAIRIMKAGATWGVDDIAAYDIQDNLWLVDVSVSTDRGGDAFIGNINNDNLSGEVDAAATYNLRFEDIQADGGNLILYGVCVGLRVYIY